MLMITSKNQLKNQRKKDKLFEQSVGFFEKKKNHFRLNNFSSIINWDKSAFFSDKSTNKWEKEILKMLHATNL